MYHNEINFMSPRGTGKSVTPHMIGLNLTTFGQIAANLSPFLWTFRRLHTCASATGLSAHDPLQVWVRDAVEAQYFLDYRTGRVWHKEQVHHTPNGQPSIILGFSTN